ncbi:TPA: ABC transporter permease [Thermoplasmata archaeon]|nr:ABC transporter permease [Thermoplasmata archaeon]
MAHKSFRKMILKRSFYVVLTIFGIITVNFLLVHLMPGDPIHNMIPRDPKFNYAIREQLIDKFHLDAPLWEQYLIYLKNTVTLDWGDSYMQDRAVLDIIMVDMSWTLLLVGTSTVITLILGMLIGAYAAYRRGGAFDLGSTGLLLFFYGMPIFWFAIILQILFNSYPFEMDWWPQLPIGGYYDVVEYKDGLKWELPVILSVIEHMILPSMTMAIGSLAGVTLVMRSSLIDVMTEDFVMTAKAKGLTDYQVLRYHAFPNGLPPMIALIAMSIAFVIGGAYQVEVIFNYRGIGLETINAIYNLDFPILQFIIVVGGVAGGIANFLSDIILLYIDPRIKIA